VETILESRPGCQVAKAPDKRILALAGFDLPVTALCQFRIMLTVGRSVAVRTFARNRCRVRVRAVAPGIAGSASKDSALSGGMPPVTAFDGYRTVELVCACYQSAAEKRASRI
jgi:hypothetical protein